MTEQYRVTPEVAVAVMKLDRVLLLRRTEEGSQAGGYYELPSTKSISGEDFHKTAVRALQENLGINVIPNPMDLRLVHICKDDSLPEGPYLGLIFKTEKWEGEPAILRPSEYDNMGFFDIMDPPKILPRLPRVIRNLGMRAVSVNFTHHKPGELEL